MSYIYLIVWTPIWALWLGVLAACLPDSTSSFSSRTASPGGSPPPSRSSILRYLITRPSLWLASSVESAVRGVANSTSLGGTTGVVVGIDIGVSGAAAGGGDDSLCCASPSPGSVMRYSIVNWLRFWSVEVNSPPRSVFSKYLYLLLW